MKFSGPQTYLLEIGDCEAAMPFYIRKAQEIKIKKQQALRKGGKKKKKNLGKNYNVRGKNGFRKKMRRQEKKWIFFFLFKTHIRQIQ